MLIDRRLCLACNGSGVNPVSTTTIPPACMGCGAQGWLPLVVLPDPPVSDDDPVDPSDIVPAGHFERLADWLKNGHARHLAALAELAAVKAEVETLRAQVAGHAAAVEAAYREAFVEARNRPAAVLRVLWDDSFAKDALEGK